MKKIFLLIAISCCYLFLFYSFNVEFFSKNTARYQLNSEAATSESIKENQQDGADASTVAIYTGVGLVTTGGAGALIIANNKKKEKNVPSAEIKVSNDDE